MSTLCMQLAAIRQAIETPTDGFVGMVDTVLSLCRQHALRLHWRDNRCSVRTATGDEEEALDIPLRTSAFRSVLARVATLCDEQVPGSFAPYGGEGELALGSDPRKALHLTWVNTTDEQALTVTPILPPADMDSQGPAMDQKRWLDNAPERDAALTPSNRPRL